MKTNQPNNTDLILILVLLLLLLLLLFVKQISPTKSAQNTYSDWKIAIREREREREREWTEVDRLPPVSTATDPPSTATDRLIMLLLKQIGACWSRFSSRWSRSAPGPELEPQRLTPGPELDASRGLDLSRGGELARTGPTATGMLSLSLSPLLSIHDSLLILKTWSYWLGWIREYLFCLPAFDVLSAECWPCGVLVLVSGPSGPCEVVPGLK